MSKPKSSTPFLDSGAKSLGFPDWAAQTKALETAVELARGSGMTMKEAAAAITSAMKTPRSGRSALLEAIDNYQYAPITDHLALMVAAEEQHAEQLAQVVVKPKTRSRLSPLAS